MKMIKMENEIRKQMETMGKLVDEYADSLKTKIEIDENIVQLIDKMTKKEIKVKEEIYSEIDEVTGKKKHTNEEMRRNATNKQLEADEWYAGLKNQYEKLVKEDNNIKAEIDILNKKISIAKKQSELMIALVELKKLR